MEIYADIARRMKLSLFAWPLQRLNPVLAFLDRRGHR